MRRIAEEAERQRLIADLSSLNARLQRGYASLRREVTQKSGLMGLIAHDLRSPLSAIMSQAELGRARLKSSSAGSEKLDSGFAKIIDNADRMADLIHATLERVRTDSEALQISARPCDLTSLASIAVEANRPEARRKDITLHFTPCSEITAKVGDVLIISAIDNLISNALKYTHARGEVHVELSMQGDEARICVTDTGQGLTRDDLQRVFGRFQRLSATPTGGESSIGLGLANVREVVQAHDGTVIVQSDGPGKGSRFIIALPLTGASGT